MCLLAVLFVLYYIFTVSVFIQKKGFVFESANSKKNPFETGQIYKEIYTNLYKKKQKKQQQQ